MKKEEILTVFTTDQGEETFLAPTFQDAASGLTSALFGMLVACRNGDEAAIRELPAVVQIVLQRVETEGDKITADSRRNLVKIRVDLNLEEIRRPFEPSLIV